MPPQLRDPSTNTVDDLPSECNIATMTTATTTIEAPLNALPQRQRFMNTTQLFQTNNSRNGDRDNDNDRKPTVRQPATTATYRRRQRRTVQHQYPQDEQNRFAPLTTDTEQAEATDMDHDIETNSTNKS
jgi:hypothetical protein